ncbi:MULTISPECIES: hypothetical protein [Paenibacillus]|uniref:Uncharacterized protein n=1 Tax=Paenibacillus pabuli TaxID=1472 RepID=A0A855XUE3_9BACL|nr:MULTISPECIES: hypothetical protein [Paenibacillus]PWW37383.1 hypothetical protein DET56_109270 [Paenibacillus pabuli]PXW05525.1 hypothetical protein DEU73_108269 [Paenibacillus taichungensis]
MVTKKTAALPPTGGSSVNKPSTPVQEGKTTVVINLNLMSTQDVKEALAQAESAVDYSNTKTVVINVNVFNTGYVEDEVVDYG